MFPRAHAYLALALCIPLGLCGCGDDSSAAPADAFVEGVVTNASGTPIEGALINFVYEFASETSIPIVTVSAQPTAGLNSFPNPFGDHATLQFEVASVASGALEMFDDDNQSVAVLLLETRLLGTHRVVWDGRNEGGQLTPSGLYHARLNLTGTNLDVSEEVRVFRNIVDPGAFTEVWTARTDANGEFSIPAAALPVGESFPETDNLGVPGDPLVVTDMVTVWATLPGNPPRHASTRVSVAQNVFVELRIP